MNDTTKIELPPPHEGKYVLIRKLTGKQIVDSMRKDYGLSIVVKGVVSPRLTEKNVNDMPLPLFFFLRNAICEISGYTFRGLYPKPEFKSEFLSDDEKTQNLLLECGKTVEQHGLSSFMKRMILSGDFSRSLAKWQTYNVIEEKFRWDNLRTDEQEKLVEKNKLSEIIAGGTALNYDPRTGIFSTILLDVKKITKESMEFIILHELQHNLNALSNPQFIANCDEEILETRIREYMRQHNIEKSISPYLAIQVVRMVNELFVEKEMCKSAYFMTYCENKLSLLSELAKMYYEESPEEKWKKYGVPFYLIIELIPISSVFKEREAQLYPKVEEMLSYFPNSYVKSYRVALEITSKLDVETVELSHIFQIIESFEVFNEAFVSLEMDNRENGGAG